MVLGLGILEITVQSSWDEGHSAEDQESAIRLSR